MDDLAHKRRKQTDHTESHKYTNNALWAQEPERRPKDILSDVEEPTDDIGNGLTTDTGQRCTQK